MTDLRERFRDSSGIPVPDLWPDIEDRVEAGRQGVAPRLKLTRTGVPPRSHAERLRASIAVAAALAVLAGSLALVARALRSDSNRHPADQPPPASGLGIPVGSFGQINGWITYADADGLLAVDPADPRSLVRLALEPLAVRPLAWSKDGSRLLFVRWHPGQEVADLVVRTSDGTEVVVAHRVPNLGASGGSFTPDGSAVVYAKDGSIYEVASGGGRPQVLVAGHRTNGGLVFSRVALSPDGTRLAYLATVFEGTNDGAGLIVSNLDGSRGHVVAGSMLAPAGDVNGVAWSPDGTRLAFGGVADQFASQVYVVNADGSHVRALTSVAQGSWNGVPTWSPDGSRIAFQSFQHGVVTMGADGTDFRVLGIRGPTVWNPVG